MAVRQVAGEFGPDAVEPEDGQDLVSRSGETFLVAPGFGDNQSKGDGYGVGQIDLPDGPRVQALLLGERGSFRIGMPMEMVLVPTGKDKQGRDLLMYRFRAVEG